MKYGILRELNKWKCDVIVVFYNVIVEEVFQLKLDGIMLFNGSGDLKDVFEVIEMIKGVFGKVLLFGICFGYQLFVLVCGVNIEKMKFGYRGLNYLVKELVIGKVVLIF